MKLFYAPASSYSQKVVIGLYEKEIAFTPTPVDLFDPDARQAYLTVNPFGRIPSLELDDGRTLIESTIILEYLDTAVPDASKLIPGDPSVVLETRFLERVVDLYVNTPRNVIFHDRQKAPELRGGPAIDIARAEVQAACQLLDERLSQRTWLAGDRFSIADCAAAPTLRYLRLVFAFDDFLHLTDYAQRLAQRPACARAWTEGLPQLRAMLKNLPYPLEAAL